jgi:hypothetical protein
MKMKLFAITTSLALLVSLVVPTTYNKQFAFAAPFRGSLGKFNIDNVNSSDYVVCATSCHAQPAYRLVVEVPGHGASGVAIFIKTANGYTDHANVNTSMITGIARWTFKIPQNQGNWVQVCDISETRPYCVKYSTTGSDMLVSLSAVAYQLTVEVPFHPFGASTLDISITTKNGYTDHANVPAAGVATWTFNIPQNQGNWVKVCINAGILNHAYCHTYQATGKNMLVSLSIVAYQLTVTVPFHPFGASTVDIYITTKNGYTDEATASTAGVSTWTFNIPQNQGNWVQVCVNFSPNCHKYETSGSDMSVLFREALASP